MLFIVQTAMKLGCIYALVSLALFLSFRILKIADMTTDGCFILGGAVSVVCALSGHPVAGLFMAMLAGSLAGLITAFLQTRMGVPSILAGIITNTGLYTINLMVMGWSSNVSLLKAETIFSLFKSLGIGIGYEELIVSGIVVIIAMVLVRLFLSTRLGLSLRATGDNPEMVSASSINPGRMIMIGLALSNSLTALSGALAAQMQRSIDINAGTGIVVIGLACLIIGETLLGAFKNMSANIGACLLGSIIYRLIYAVILKTHVIPIDCLKLMTALIVALAISFPTISSGFAYRMKQRKEREEC